MITENAMLAAIHISIWTAVKHDRKVSRDVADQHGAHQARAATTSSCCAARTSWTNFERSPGRSGSTSTRSPCPGRTKAFACCQRTSISISWRACVNSRQASNRESKLSPCLSAIHRAGEAGTERPLPRGRLPVGGNAADEVRLEAGNPAYPERRRLPRSDVGRRTGAGLARDRCECPGISDTWNRGFVEAASGSSRTHGRPAERTGIALPWLAGHQCPDLVEILPHSTSMATLT